MGGSVTKGSLVITYEKYKADFHNPRNKFGDKVDERLKDGDLMVNLSVKIGDYYITIATFPKLETVKKHFDDEYYKKYETWITGLTNKLGNNLISELPITKLPITLISSVQRFIERDTSDKKIVRTIKERLEQSIGVTYKFGTFPSVEDEFKKFYNNYSFGNAIGDSVLTDLYKKYKGKKYIEVGFGNLNSTKKLIALSNTNHTVPKIIKIINNYIREINKSNKFDPEVGIGLGSVLVNPIQIKQILKNHKNNKKFVPILNNIVTTIFGSKAGKVDLTVNNNTNFKAFSNIFRAHTVINANPLNDKSFLQVLALHFENYNESKKTFTNTKNETIEEFLENKRVEIAKSTESDQIKQNQLNILNEVDTIIELYKLILEKSSNKIFTNSPRITSKNSKI